MEAQQVEQTKFLGLAYLSQWRIGAVGTEDSASEVATLQHTCVWHTTSAFNENVASFTNLKYNAAQLFEPNAYICVIHLARGENESNFN